MAKKPIKAPAVPVAVTRLVTVIARDANGTASVVADSVPLDCTEDFKAVDALVQSQKDSGSIMVMVLLDDDSVSRHWTKPLDETAQDA